jgi:YesN/AraC family two-component response regulator
LLDLLNEVNRRLHEAPEADSPFHRNRLDLIVRFGTGQSLEQARRAFLPALNRLLSVDARRGRSTHPLVRRARAFIDAEYQRRLSLSAVAARLHVSPNHLSRLFRREVRMTLTEYIHRVRLAHTRRLMARSGRSMAEIAYRVGYQNYRDFYRNFVKYENAAPSRVRQQMSKGGRGAGSLPMAASASSTARSYRRSDA